MITAENFHLDVCAALGHPFGVLCLVVAAAAVTMTVDATFAGALVFVGVGAFGVALRAERRHAELTSEIAALQAQLASRRMPWGDQTPGQG